MELVDIVTMMRDAEILLNKGLCGDIGLRWGLKRSCCESYRGLHSSDHVLDGQMGSLQRYC